MSIDDKPRYMTMERVAEILSCSERHVYRLVIEGKLEAIKIGGRAVRISEKSLHDFIETSRVNPEDLFDPDIEKKESSDRPPIARSKWMQK
jgi:excisionase family DNA binding protein